MSTKISKKIDQILAKHDEKEQIAALEAAMRQFWEKVKVIIGTRVFNHGDMANIEHFGTITAIESGHYEITPDADSERTKPYCIPFCLFSPVYKGHGGTRFVTEEAYEAFRAEQIATFQNWRNRLASK